MNLGKLIAIALALGMAGAVAQTTPPSPAGPPLTLAQAQAAALARRPLLQEAQSQANAAGQEPAAVRATEMPQLAGDLTGVGAEANSRITAGGLNNPVIYSRYANGINVSQLVTNFGRTGQLVKSASNQAQAQRQDAAATRADVLLQVDRAYFSALQAQAVLRVAQQAVEERQLIARQVGVLAQNKLRSNLDVSFAQVNLAQAQLLLSQAQSGQQSTLADLALAMGTALPTPAPQLEEQPLPAAPAQDLAPLVAQALLQRPEMAAADFQLDAARAYAQAQRDLERPTVSAVAAAGWTPTGAVQLPGHYAAAGVNVNIPIFNGGLFGAERRQAEYQADAAQHRLDELSHQIAHDVQLAWLDANTANQQLALTRELQQQAALAMTLAKSRYQLGLGSIVELSQAQLNQTQADIAQAQAQYQYQSATAALRYQMGLLR
ncbi:MAG TPA: TolC family protein [Terriglobales bacterium]|nr:TolC family protein [Terriglobales bacterium]